MFTAGDSLFTIKKAGTLADLYVGRDAADGHADSGPAIDHGVLAKQDRLGARTRRMELHAASITREMG